MDDTIAAIATPSGEGGIHIVRLSGPDAHQFAFKLFKARDHVLPAPPPQKVVFGTIQNPKDGQVIDEVLLTWFQAPHSYTAEDVVEISCHGGAFISQRILQLLLEQGARLAQPGEFTRRAFLHGKIDLTQAEAVADLIHAASDKAHSLALSQLQGRLSRELNAYYESMIAVLAQLEAAIDFPEEGLEFRKKKELAGHLKGVQKEIDAIVQSFRTGKIYREGARVALVGKPNVGKSSLLNALLQEDRAIVTPHPGTTRDVLEERMRLKDIHINIVDTAGIRHQPETIEEQGIERTQRAIGLADWVLVLLDGSEPLDANDEMLLKEVGDKPRMILVNKNDLPRKLKEADLKKLAATDVAGKYNTFSLSATSGDGIDAILDALYENILAATPSGEGAVITRERHREALAQCSEALGRVVDSLNQDLSEDLVAVDLNAALEHLGGLLGKVFVDDLLDQIFDDFCIGK